MQQMSNFIETSFGVTVYKGIVKRRHQFSHLQKGLGIRSAFLLVQDSLGASLNPRVE